MLSSVVDLSIFRAVLRAWLATCSYSDQMVRGLGVVVGGFVAGEDDASRIGMEGRFF